MEEPLSAAEEMASVNLAKQQLRAAVKQRLAGVTNVAEQSETILRTLTSLPPFLSARRIGVYLAMPTREVQTEPIVQHALKQGKEVWVPYLHRNPALSTRLGAGKDGGAVGPPPMKRVMDMVRLKGLEDLEVMERDRWGIPSLNEEMVGERERVFGEDGEDNDDGEQKRQRPTLDLILMPGVAFEVQPREGGGSAIARLGHGGGFYDYFLERLRKRCWAEAHHLAGSSNSSREGEEVEAEEQRMPRLYGLALVEQVLGEGPDGQKAEVRIPCAANDVFLEGVVVGDGRVLR